MGSAWGNAWGSSWGNSWGTVTTGGGGGGDPVPPTDWPPFVVSLGTGTLTSVTLEHMYTQGQMVRCTGTFVNTSTGVNIDPDNVAFRYQAPKSTVVHTFVYGVDAEVVREGVGIYHVDLDATIPGRWRYRFESTGATKAAEDKSFLIVDSQLVT